MIELIAQELLNLGLKQDVVGRFCKSLTFAWMSDKFVRACAFCAARSMTAMFILSLTREVAARKRPSGDRVTMWTLATVWAAERNLLKDYQEARIELKKLTATATHCQEKIAEKSHG